MIAYCVLISGIFIIPLSIHNVYIITISWTIITTLGSINVVTFFTERQKRVSKDILARVVSVSRMIAYFAIPFGAILGGYLTNLYHSSVIIIMAGLFRISVGIWAVYTKF